MLNISLQKSDALGVLSSALCMLHCIATPFIFLATATSCSISCCGSAPAWYQWLDYVFIFISFFAVMYSTKSSKNNWIKLALWVSWLSLVFVIINANIFQWFYVSNNVKFIPSFSLIGFHFYNMRYCQCKEENCC
tara:strand:- start:166 stop:570 length:405 start_codon:yes stop_codon:yes gene_type:complete